MSTLAEISNSMAALVSQADPSIVQVAARRRVAASGVVWSADGLIVTANHVVRREDKIRVGLPDGSQVAASLVGRDPTTDLVVIKAEASDLTAATWAGADEVQVGQLVLAAGRPGASVQVTLGVVSALSDGWRTPAGGQVAQYLQTDVLMYPGFSGGPLIGATGQFLGLNSSGLMRGVSLTIPTATVKRVVNDLLAHGKIRRGYLGVSTQAVRLPQALAEQFSQESGLMLVAVEPDSPAESSGLLLGDTIVTFDQKATPHHDDLLALLSGDRVGVEVPVQLIRGGQLQAVAVTIGERG